MHYTSLINQTTFFWAHIDTCLIVKVDQAFDFRSRYDLFAITDKSTGKTQVILAHVYN